MSTISLPQDCNRLGQEMGTQQCCPNSCTIFVSTTIKSMILISLLHKLLCTPGVEFPCIYSSSLLIDQLKMDLESIISL